MSRLLRDATKANAAGRTVAPAIQEDADEFMDFPDEPPQPVKVEKQKPQPAPRPGIQKTFNDDTFDAKAFAKDFFSTLEDFGNLRKAVPEDLNSFSDYDRFIEGSLPEIRLEVRLEMDTINQQLHDTFARIRQLEFTAENAVKMNKDKGFIYGMLFDRKDLQNKVALLTKKKMNLLTVKERLDSFEMFAELSRDFGAFQKVATSFVNEHKVYFPDGELDPKVKMSLAYSQTHVANKGFVVDKEPIHDYHLVELPLGNSRLKEQIDLEYYELLRNCSKAV